MTRTVLSCVALSVVLALGAGCDSSGATGHPGADTGSEGSVANVDEASDEGGADETGDDWAGEPAPQDPGNSGPATGGTGDETGSDWDGGDDWDDTGDTSDDWGADDTGDDTGWGGSASEDAASSPSADASGSGGSSGGTSPDPGPDPEACSPSCTGKQCGPDGCGGSCGWCGGFDSCQSGACVEVEGCEPACAGQMIGIDDGCGGVCTGSGMGIGLAPGGAQDAAYFKKLVLEGEVPSPDVLPIEGWLNEHGTPLPPPEPDRLVTLHGFAGLFYDPSQGEPLVALQLGLNSGLPPQAIEDGHFNLCVVVDASGSMDGDDRIGFVKDGLKAMLSSLDEHDTLSIVTYSTEAQVLVSPQAVTNHGHLVDMIDAIDAGGWTNLHAGLQLGYEQVMLNAANSDQIPRVILLSDGVVTKGVTDPAQIQAMSAEYNDLGIGLTTIGVGIDFDFDLMHNLAVGGGGNFYFLDSAEKLTDVFRDEIEYLLTPVADNLKISFNLPEAFAVDDIYGFEFTVGEDGQVHVLAPSPQYEIDDETADDPGNSPPDDGADEDPMVAVSTLFASKDNGLVMVRLTPPGADIFAALEQTVLSTLTYSYDLVEEGVTEHWEVPVQLGSLEYENEAFSFFSGAIMQRNFCVLRAGLAMKLACGHIEDSGDEGIQPAIVELAQARTFCEGVNVQLNDPKIDDDVELIEMLMENICVDCVDPAAAP